MPLHVQIIYKIDIWSLFGKLVNFSITYGETKQKQKVVNIYYCPSVKINPNSL